MRSFWSDPYLWVHLAGLATLPLWLELCLLGLAMGDPILPVWLELGLVGLAGVAPLLWMQLQRPFCIFSLVAVVLKPAQLTEEQRKLLTLFKSARNQVLAVLTAIAMLVLLRQIYEVAPIASAIAPLAGESRWLGLLIAAIAFLGANLFAQVPVSVASVLLVSDSTFSTTEPYPVEQIRQAFTLLGLPVNQILPPLTPMAAGAAVVADGVPPELSVAAPAPVPDPWSEATETTGEAPEPVESPEPEVVESQAVAQTVAQAAVEGGVTAAPAAQNPPSDPVAEDPVAEHPLVEPDERSQPTLPENDTTENQGEQRAENISENSPSTSEETSMLGSESSEASQSTDAATDASTDG